MSRRLLQEPSSPTGKAVSKGQSRSLSLRAERSNPPLRCTGRGDCFVAGAPRNDSNGLCGPPVSRISSARVFRGWAVYLLILPLVGASFPALGDKYDPTTLVFPSFLHTLGIRKATKMHLRIYTRNKVKVRNPQGIAVVRLTSWDDPNEKKDDDEVTGYGINSGENVIVYNTSMTSLGVYGKKERGARTLSQPTDVAANESGDVYVTDTGNHRIVRFRNPKKQLEFVRGIGGRGALPGHFQSPTGIAMDSQGKVYISDTGNHRVQVLLPDDMLHVWFGKQGVADGHLWHPTGIAVADQGQAWSFYRDDFVALVDLDHTRIQKLDLHGEYLKSTRLSDFGFQSGRLAYLAIDYYSNIWVTDTENHCIHKFDRDLNYLTSFGRKGSDDKEFNEPRGIAIYRRFGQVFIAEKESAQYYWIGTDVLNFTGQWDEDLAIIVLDLFLTEPSFVTLHVEPAGEEEVEVLVKKQYFSGQQQIFLEGTWKRIPLRTVESLKQTANGSLTLYEPVASGEYTFKLKIEPTYSSYRYFSKEVETIVLVE